MTSGPRKSDRITLVFTCVGRRVELLQAFRAAARRLGVLLHLVGIDSDLTAPALSCVDTPVVAPLVSDAGYVALVLDTIRRHDATGLIPTTDTDLLALSRNRQNIADLGCEPFIGTSDIIGICRDKVQTYHHLRTHGIDTPQTWTPAELKQANPPPFPLFIKPRTGSASLSVHKVEDDIDLAYFLKRVPDPIVQEFVAGTEHTLDVYVGLTGVPRCVVPRVRWQVRAGEVARGVAVKDRDIMAAGQRVVETLGTSVRGLVTLQCIVTPQRRIRFIEINPRFGGGAPLGIAAGADYPRWILQELRGEDPQVVFDGFRHGMCMLRYDWSVFLPLDPDCQPRLARPLRDFPAFE